MTIFLWNEKREEIWKCRMNYILTFFNFGDKKEARETYEHCQTIWKIRCLLSSAFLSFKIAPNQYFLEPVQRIRSSKINLSKSCISCCNPIKNSENCIISRNFMNQKCDLFPIKSHHYYLLFTRHSSNHVNFGGRA